MKLLLVRHDINRRDVYDFFPYIQVILGDGTGVTAKVRALAAKPSRYGVQFSGYIINGLRFHSLSREAARLTQNSGVVNIVEEGSTIMADY